MTSNIFLYFSEKIKFESSARQTIYMKCQGLLAVKLNFKNAHLTRFSLESPKRVIGKQCRPRSDVAEPVSDQDLHCLH